MENNGYKYEDLISRCLNCGIVTVSIKGKKKKRFCSDRCRWDWWNNHIKEMKQQAKSDKNIVSK